MRQVRAFLAGLLNDCPAAGDAVLLADELAANAVQHSRSRGPGGTFTVTVEACPGHWVRVEVADDGGPGVPHLADDGASTSNSTGNKASGRGLQIVTALAGEWGVAGDATGRTVWFVLPWGLR
jgi:anti-sigma regulatory factor (Ser/Thr protein kinase)